MSGGSMADRLRSMGETGERFSENQLLIYLRQTTSALKHAWSVAVYHGDLNPGNLLLDGQGDIKLANLGVPRVAKPRKGMASNARTSLRFVRCGPEYAAPEQLDAPELVNARTDMYSLGATFYHLSFGVPPFSGKDRGDILEFRRKNPVPQFSLKSQEGFSGKYLRLIHDMLEVDPEKRPADPEELADRLENFHIADVDELSGLARQVRDVAGPIGVASSARQATPRVRAPVDGAGMRNYSLAPRSKYMKMGRGGYWAIAAAVAIAVISIVAFFL
ncbi:MAG: protein kinase [Planctomycetes bacterium]|nr:protein kinase [Planctomycetota bacterium]